MGGLTFFWVWELGHVTFRGTYSAARKRHCLSAKTGVPGLASGTIGGFGTLVLTWRPRGLSKSVISWGIVRVTPCTVL